MKRPLAIVAVIAAVFCASQVGAQTRPKFSGRWVQVSPADGAGQEQVIKHEGDSLSATHPSSGDDHELKYTLDGKETTQTLTSHGQPLTSRVRASWDKDSLVIITTTQTGQGTGVSLRQTWSLDKAGQLVIVVAPTVNGTDQAPVTVTYARKPQSR